MIAMSVRTRFAPSPTGFLHLGNIRSALFPWAFARHHGARSSCASRTRTRSDRRSRPSRRSSTRWRWLGLDYDEGPYYQMQRMDRYRAVLDDMLATRPRLPLLHDAGRSSTSFAPSRWRAARSRATTAAGGPRTHAIESRRPASRRCSDSAIPTTASSRGATRVKGPIEIANAELDDLVIARSDGTPTYNFCVVVDDIDMRITHVIRGDDHVNNTPRQINIMRALGATPPVYAHLPTVLTPDGEKLSKRHGARGVLQYRDDGYLREAIVNYLARLGWAHGDAEVFGVDEFVGWFDLAGLVVVAGTLRPRQARSG